MEVSDDSWTSNSNAINFLRTPHVAVMRSSAMQLLTINLNSVNDNNFNYTDLFCND